MGASASSPSLSGGQTSDFYPPLHTQNVFATFSSSTVDQFGKEKKKKGASLSTLRKRLTRRRRISKNYDHAQIFRDFLADWSPRDVITLVEEYEALMALKELAVAADLARPAANACKQDLGTLFEYKYCSDINLIYQGTVFPVHRAVLAARCPFFRELLNSLSSLCTEVAVDIDIAGVSVSMFNELLRYLYTGDLSVAEQYEGSLDILFQLSEQFGIPNPLQQDLRYLLETGMYSDISLTFTSRTPAGGLFGRAADGTPSVVCDHLPPEAEGKTCKVCHGEAEYWCHRAILSARSPFFRNVIRRQQRRSIDMQEPCRTRVVLDESIIPRRFARILLHAVYQDTFDFSALLLEASKKGVPPEGGGPQKTLVDEAMHLYEVARFIELDVLVHMCEDFIAESLSLDTLVSVLQWSCQPHGSQWVHRQAVHFIREEFSAVAASPALYQLTQDQLAEVITSDFLQAGEMEVWQAVLKWGEHQLFKRVEEREPNVVSHTAHSVSRRGLRRRDLSDGELRDLLSDLLCHVRFGHILPPDSELLTAAAKRGLVITPPSYMLGGDMPGPQHVRPSWVLPPGRRRPDLYARPRLFLPYVEEAKVPFLLRQYTRCVVQAWLEEQLGPEVSDVGRRQVWHISHIPDTLYMVEKPSLAFHEGFVPHLCPPPASVKGVVLDDQLVHRMRKREEELRSQCPAVRRAYSLVANHCDVTKQVQLRVVREFGLPDSTLEILHRSSYMEDPPPPRLHRPQPPPPPAGGPAHFFLAGTYQ
ncbi:BTBD7 [Cordylochernes scorpioides]|uniref:BTBD7 n=1 Tax=Cordylochernes scorpioides TaxID=51811 RepID=A0ABY6K7J7_9ARAC|nr:BTBD7 [Cordylochernes scorpioides]